MSSRLMPLVASCATVGMLLAGLPASAVAVGTTSGSVRRLVLHHSNHHPLRRYHVADMDEREEFLNGVQAVHRHTARGLARRVRREVRVHGCRGHHRSEDRPADVRPERLRPCPPDSATFEMTYLGYRGNPTATDTDTIKGDPPSTPPCAPITPQTAARMSRPARPSRSSASTTPHSSPSPSRSSTVRRFTRATPSPCVPANTKKVTVDVTEIVRQQFAEGKKVITLAVGETKKTEVRFASSEGTTSLNGATADMAPKLTVSVSTKDDLKPSADTTLQAWAKREEREEEHCGLCRRAATGRRLRRLR